MSIYSLYCRVLNRDIPLLDCQVTIPQNKVGTLELIIPMKPFWDEYDDERAIRQALRYQDISVYAGSVLVRSGYIKDAINATFGKTFGFLKLKCEDEFGRLTQVWSKPNGHYQETFLTSAISDLLTLASDWELGDTTTMVDDEIPCTVNLRSKERLWAQVLGAVESVSNMFIRYGGVDGISGNNLIDIGLFGEQDDSRFATDDYNCIDVRQKRTPNDIIYAIRGKGGKAGDTIIKLTGAETATAGFPIALDATTGEYYVYNENVSNGVYVAKTYSEIRTQNSEPPTSDEINEARQALYEVIVRDLTLSEERETLELDVGLPEIPLIGQDIIVRSVVRVPAIDIFTGRVTYRAARYVNAYYRITAVKLKWKDSPGVIIAHDPWTDEPNVLYRTELEVTDGLDVADYDEITFLAKKLTNQDEDEPFGAGIGLGGTYTISVNHASVASDCSTGVSDGKLFQFDMNPEPSAAIQTISYTVLELPDNREYTITQEPALPNTPLILCVTGENDTNWDTGDDATVNIQYTYYT